MSSKKTHLITPPQASDEQPQQHKAHVVHNFIQNSAGYVTSLWKDPAVDVQSVFGCSQPRPEAYTVYLKEVLRRSRCALPALQVALFYLSKLQKLIKDRIVDQNTHLMCPKKVFLVCLILSYKYNYDSNYSFKAWSKVSGLSITEIKLLEIAILGALDYNLNLNETYTKWVDEFSQKTYPVPVETVPAHGVKRVRDDFTSAKRIKV